MGTQKLTKEEVVEILTVGKELDGVLFTVDPETLGVKDPEVVAKAWVDSMSVPVGIMYWYEAGRSGPFNKKAVERKFDSILEYVKNIQEDPDFVGWPDIQLHSSN